ncbi:MAG: type I restriction enzyme HsdR N-terminal domain-containing protein [Bacteroidota bacterium]
MIPLYDIQTKFEGERPLIWGQIRKAWYVWQPEEVVRQQLISHLIHDKGISPNLIGVEKEIVYNQTRRRFDVVVFDKMGQPFVLVECKAPDVKLDSDTLFQAARYNSILQAPYLILFNGKTWVFFSKNEEGFFSISPGEWYK